MKLKILLPIMGVTILALIVVVVFVTIPHPPPDVRAPEVAFVDLKKYQMLSGTANITFIATDDRENDTGVALYQLYLDNSLVGESEINGSFIVDTTAYHDGYHNLSAVAIDHAGNKGELNLTISIDNKIDPPRTDMFKIMTYNILESGEFKTWIDVVEKENPDIAVFVETGKWDDSGNSKLHLYTRQLNGYFYDYAPYESCCTQHVKYSTSGEAIMSRYDIISFKQIEELILDDNTTWYPTHDPFDAEVNISGMVTHIIGVHLKASYGEDNQLRREKEQEGLINYMDSLGDVPIIYLGDFNCNSPDDTPPPIPDLGTGPITMLLHPEDPIYGNRSSMVHNFTDVFRALNPDDPGWTFNTVKIGRIDYIFVNQHFTDLLINSSVYNTALAKESSDHYPVDAWIRIPQSSSQHLPTYSYIKSFSAKRPQLQCNYNISFEIFVLYVKKPFS
ncbi:MAG: endonuclease/exonuclease/phosphatase family protein [Candidatus Heimdallarchaeaceae archaeon]